MSNLPQTNKQMQTNRRTDDSTEYGWYGDFMGHRQEVIDRGERWPEAEVHKNNSRSVEWPCQQVAPYATRVLEECEGAAQWESRGWRRGGKGWNHVWWKGEGVGKEGRSLKEIPFRGSEHRDPTTKLLSMTLAIIAMIINYSIATTGGCEENQENCRWIYKQWSFSYLQVPECPMGRIKAPTHKTSTEVPVSVPMVRAIKCPTSPLHGQTARFLASANALIITRRESVKIPLGYKCHHNHQVAIKGEIKGRCLSWQVGSIHCCYSEDHHMINW